MFIQTLKSKISYAKVTQKDLYYVGSISIAAAWMEQASLSENEKVQVVNLILFPNHKTIRQHPL